MVDYRRHFSLVIFDEGQLRAIDRAEEIRFRFGIKIESAPENAHSPGLSNQLISLSPDRQLHSSAKHVVRRKFVLADTGIVKFCIQLDDDTRWYVVSFWRVMP